MGPRKLCTYSQHPASKEKQPVLSGMVSSQCVYTALFSHQFPQPWEAGVCRKQWELRFCSRVSGRPANQQWHHNSCHREVGAHSTPGPAQALDRKNGEKRERRLKHQLKRKKKKKRGVKSDNNRLAHMCEITVESSSSGKDAHLYYMRLYKLYPRNEGKRTDDKSLKSFQFRFFKSKPNLMKITLGFPALITHISRGES